MTEREKLLAQLVRMRERHAAEVATTRARLARLSDELHQIADDTARLQAEEAESAASHSRQLQSLQAVSGADSDASTGEDYVLLLQQAALGLFELNEARSRK